MAQPTNPDNFCNWMSAPSTGVKEILACDGTTVSLNPGTNNYDNSVTFKWYNGNTTPGIVLNAEGFYWVDITKNGCTHRDSFNFKYVTPPVVKLGNDTILCVGDSLILDVANPGASYQWNGNFADNQSSMFVVKQAGKFRARVSVPGCVVSDTIEVLYKNPVNSFSLGADKILCNGDSIVLVVPIPNETYLWQDNSTKQMLTVKTPGLYSVTMTDACGTYTDAVNVSSANCKFYIPNAFTPNNDGKNDIFQVMGFDNISFFRFSIFNRWGIEVFSTNDPSKGWNGLFKGIVQPVGVYVWTLQYKKSYTPATISEQGTVTLIR